MQTTKLSLFDFFARGRHYEVPLFQRPYVWSKEKQWDPLWQDIAERAEEVLDRQQHSPHDNHISNHFLGAVVTNQRKHYGLQIPAVEIIDGQQRLTTLQIMLAAFRDVIQTTGEQNLSSALQQLKNLTENSGLHDRNEERFKVWPTNIDQKDFAASMTAGSAEELNGLYPRKKKPRARKYDPRPKLVEAYLFFTNAVQSFCSGTNTSEETTPAATQNLSDFSIDRANALFKALQDHIQIVEIELDKEDDPQVIFETLNYRGTPLLPSDLIRNFVFLQAKRQGENVEDLYLKWWSDYDKRPADSNTDEGGLFWKQMERQGRINRPRLDLFLFHYVQYKSAQNLEIGHLFNAFQHWWRKGSDRNVADELEELRRHSDEFSKIFVPEGKSRVDIFARRMRTLDTTTIYPILLMLLIGGRERVAENDLGDIITDLESYLVRRMICDLSVRGYNKFFFSVLRKLRGDKPITRTLIQDLLLENKTGPAVRWPDDKEFRKAWLEFPAYSYMKAARCTMILFAINHNMMSDRQEKITVEEDSLTVEHVLPQSWGKWPDPVESEEHGESEETAIEWRDRLLHSFGNLTLLTEKLNSAVSNGPYDKKRPKITEQSALRLNTYFQSVGSWDEAKIKERGQALFEHACKLWPYPKGAK